MESPKLCKIRMLKGVTERIFVVEASIMFVWIGIRFFYSYVFTYKPLSRKNKKDNLGEFAPLKYLKEFKYWKLTTLLTMGSRRSRRMMILGKSMSSSRIGYRVNFLEEIPTCKEQGQGWLGQWRIHREAGMHGPFWRTGTKAHHH